jgi:hypothetical protein
MEMNLSLTALMYHYIRDGDATWIPCLPLAAFEAQLDGLMRDYEMIGWNEVRDALLENKALPERACLLTFDDGLCDHYRNVFPALRRRNLSGIFFTMARDENVLPLPFRLHYLIASLGLEKLREEIWMRLNEQQRAISQQAEARYRARWSSETDVWKCVWQRELEEVVNPMARELLAQHVGSEQELARQLFLSDEEIREMRAGGMTFGGHSATHPWFDFISPARRANEIAASKNFLEQFEPPPFAFAYPYGGLADDAPQLLQQNHFVAAFTTREQTQHTDAFYMGRFDGEEWNG